jgi:hypothetical protein
MRGFVATRCYRKRLLTIRGRKQLQVQVQVLAAKEQELALQGRVDGAEVVADCLEEIATARSSTRSYRSQNWLRFTQIWVSVYPILRR